MTEENDPQDPDNFEFEDPSPESTAPDAYDEIEPAAATGGIEAPTAVGGTGPRRSLGGPILKVAGGLVVVGAVAAAGYAFGPSLMKRSSGPAPIQAASLTKDLQSADINVRKKANDQLLRELLDSPNLPTAADIGALKELRAAASQQSDIDSQQTVQLIDQILESIGAAPAADPQTTFVTEPVSVGAFAPVAIPFPYSVVLAVIGQQPDAAPLPDKKTNYLGWFKAKLSLTDNEIKQGNYEAALVHIRDLESSGTPPTAIQQRLVEQNRRKAIEGLMKGLRKQIEDGDQQLAAALAGMTQNVTDLKDQQVPALTKAVESLTTKTNTLTDTVATLETGVDTVTKDLETVSKDLKTATVTLVDVNKTTTDLSKKFEGVTESVATATTATAALQKQLQNVDVAVRESIVAVLDRASLAERAGKLNPSPANKAAVEQAVTELAKFTPEYRDSLAKKSGDALWKDYEQLRRLEDQVADWESRQQTEQRLQALLNTPEAKKQIEALVKSGIAAEKAEAGLLADLTRLAKMSIPTDLVGKEEIVDLIKEYAPASSSSPGTGTTVVRGGITAADIDKLKATFATKADLDVRARQAELTETAAQLSDEIKAVDSRIKTYSQRTMDQLAKVEETQAKTVDTLVVLAEEVKKPRPLAPDQLAALQTGLQSTVRDSVVRELAQRGIAATTPPECVLPATPTSDADRKKALYQFNQGSAHFYQGGAEQLAAATRYFTVATNLDPNDPTFRYFLGCSLYSEGRVADGLAQVRCAAELEKQMQLGSEVNQRLERIQFATRQWLERSRQPVLQGF